MASQRAGTDFLPPRASIEYFALRCRAIGQSGVRHAVHFDAGVSEWQHVGLRTVQSSLRGLQRGRRSVKSGLRTLQRGWRSVQSGLRRLPRTCTCRPIVSLLVDLSSSLNVAHFHLNLNAHSYYCNPAITNNRIEPCYRGSFTISYPNSPLHMHIRNIVIESNRAPEVVPLRAIHPSP